MADNTLSKRKNDPRIKLNLFDLPLGHGGDMPEVFTIYDHLTFRNMVIAVSIVTFLIFLGYAVSIEISVLSAALMGLLGLLLLEISSRRKWESSLLSQFQRMNDDYERLVREVARNRNDAASLRKKLAEAAGTLARNYDKLAGEPVVATG
ncbi:MAG: hypothetical protein HY052_00205 [Proteobacteria bacterium]|nr:hypothetical protein [Pseudomonadota bacterium]